MPDSPSSTPTQPDSEHTRKRAYWLANTRILAALLAVWAVVSFGCGIIWADDLNKFRLPGSGFPLGFWFAQQGSIYTFVLIIFAYVWIMRRLDRKFGVEESSPTAPQKGGDA
jgi:putative solute:sodium symporter small subunit